MNWVSTCPHCYALTLCAQCKRTGERKFLFTRIGTLDVSVVPVSYGLQVEAQQTKRGKGLITSGGTKRPPPSSRLALVPY